VRNEFEPTLWTNLEELNGAAGATADDLQAPYQQKWFPGVHSSVGGGADWRGLSDQTLHWVWIGAMQKGSKFDTSQNSRIFELAPKFMERLVHGDDPSLSYRVMAARGTSRQNGPKHLHEVSYSAQRRWHESPDMLAEGTLYRPETLNSVARQLDKLDPMQFGVGPKYRKSIANLEYEKYPVKQGDGLRAIARKFYGKVDTTGKILEANRDLLEHPDLLFAGQVLRLPKNGLVQTP
jgi:phage tail protein X